jgi:uncharacterized repeat protein (TIGR01451 family)|tara:strand:+ start:39318 stop:42098 length:2781 start_codon:yes stop_codon:yes gene_type:complete
MAKYLLTTFFLIVSLVGVGQCPTEPITLSTQAEVDAFQINYPGCTELENNLTISGQDIFDLSSLSSISSVRSLIILSNPSLESLAGLENISSVVDLQVENNPNLISLGGLIGISLFDNIFIINNDSLENLNGLENLIEPRSSGQGILKIISNDSFNSFQGLENLERINFLTIEENEMLSEIIGFAELYYVFDLVIKNNPNLTSIDAFHNLSETTNRIDFLNNPNLQTLSFSTNFNLRPDNLRIQNTALNTLTGLSSLISVDESIDINDNPELINLNGLENLNGYLRGITIENNPNLSDLTGLSEIDEYEFITIVNNDGLINIDGVNSKRENTVSIDISGNEVLSDISSLNQISGYLKRLTIADNPSLPNLSGLEGVTGYIESLEIANNDSLENLNGLLNIEEIIVDLKINQNEILDDIVGLQNLTLLYYFEITNNPNLSDCSVTSLCNFLVNENITAIIENNAPGCNDEQEIIDGCGFVNNKVQGAIRYDFNNNNCDTANFNVSNLVVTITNANFESISTSTDVLGNYSFFVPEGEYSVYVEEQSLPVNYISNPIDAEVVFNGLGYTETVDFCLTATDIFNDLKVTLLPLNDARPGFDAHYKIVYENLGTTIMNGDVNLTFDSERQTYLSSNPTENNIEDSSITWQFEDLLPFESRSIFVDFNNLPPPTNQDGDILSFVTEINPVEEDATPENNVYEFDQTIVNSFDPNDKQVLQGEEIYEDEVDGYLDYLVRFQNTGSASAVNITVTDTLSDNLNWNTFRTLSSSHDYRVEILDGNAVSFIFEDIYLPPESSDPEGSNGHIAFQIRPNETLSIGDEVENTANIYFDFNPPIITNTVMTRVVENLSVTEFSLEGLITLHPNPVSSILQIGITDKLTFQKVKVYSILGKELMASSEKQIDTEALSSGVYFVKVITDKGNVTKKIVKQ